MIVKKHKRVKMQIQVLMRMQQRFAQAGAVRYSSGIMHIVIFTGGKSPAPQAAAAYFARRSVDFVIAADSGLETLERYRAFFGGFAPNLILGDMDSLSDKTLLTHYPAECIQRFPCDKDYSDTELALKSAYEALSAQNMPGAASAATSTQNAAPATRPWITLIGASGGRVDHFLAVFDLFATDLHPDAWLCESETLWNAPVNSSFCINALSLHDIVSVARTSENRSGGAVYSTGFEWEWNLFRTSGMPSLSNRIKKEFYDSHTPITFSVKEGAFVLITPLHAEVTRTEL